MASKRRAAVDSDSEDEGEQASSPPFKRPRTSQPGASQRDEEPILDPELESKFEKEHEDAVRQQLLGKQRNASVGVCVFFHSFSIYLCRHLGYC